jgi:hypothetical protein
MIYSRFDSALSVRVYAGEPLTLELQLTDDSGSVEQVAGRVFDLVLVDVNGLAIVGGRAPGTAAQDGSGAYVTATLDGDQTALLANIEEPGYFFREILANGTDPIVRGKIELYPAPIAGEPGAPVPAALGSSGRFLVSVTRRATRTVVVQRGARGFTPEERLAFTRNPATGLPWISEPTVEAMAAWLATLGGGGGGGAVPPDLAELIEETIAARNSAIAAAAAGNTQTQLTADATDNANTSAGHADVAADLATAQTGYAKTQGDYAKAQGIAAADKAAVAASAADLATTKAGLADTKATLADTKAALANTKATYATQQGDYAKAQGGIAADLVTQLNAVGVKYAIVPVGDVDQAALLKTLIAAGSFIPKPGGTYRADLPAAGSTFWAQANGVSSKIDWGRSTLELRVALESAIQPRSAILIANAPELDWRGLKLRMTPEPTTEGLVVSTNGVDRIQLDIDPTRWPNWPGNFDTFGVFDPVTDYCFDWQYHTDEDHRSAPQTLTQRTDLGPNRWEITFAARSLAIGPLGVISKSPLIISAPGNNLSGGEIVVFDASSTGFTIGATSVLNGKTFRAQLDGATEDGSGDLTQVRLTDPVTGADIDASAATDWVSGGAATARIIPATVAAGVKLALLFRKRGVGLLQVAACVRPRLDLDIESSGAAALHMRGCEDPTLSIRVKGKGLIGCNADIAIISDTRGTIIIPEWVVSGCGDTSIAIGTTVYLAKFLTAYGARSLTVTGWSNPLARDTVPVRPRVGDHFRYLQPNGQLDPMVNVATDVTGLTVTFAYPHPDGFNPATWRIWNEDLNAVVRVRKMSLRGNFTGACTIQCKDLIIDDFEAIGGYGNGLRISSPSSFFSGRGAGGLGKVLIRNALLRAIGNDLTRARSAAVNVRRVGPSNALPVAYQLLDIAEFGHLQIEDCPYGGVNVIGRDAVIASYGERNVGFRRYLGESSDPSANFSLHAAQGELRIGSLRCPMPTFFESVGGFVTILSGSGLATARVKATAGQASIRMPKKVQVGHEPLIEVMLNDMMRIPPEFLIANGTTDVAIHPAWASTITADDWIRGTHNRC